MPDSNSLQRINDARTMGSVDHGNGRIVVRPAMPDVYTPATLPTRFFAAIPAWFRNWRRRRRFLCLLDIDDRLLRDIGLSREAVRWGGNLPLRVNAAREVQKHRSLFQGDATG